MTPRAFALSAAGLAAAALLGHGAPARSHAIESSLERLSGLTDQLVLGSRFGNGEPAEDAVVRLVPPGGQPIEVGRTDTSGQLRFRLPTNANATWEVQVDGGPGHRDYLELPAGAGRLNHGTAERPLASPLAQGRTAGQQLLALSLLGLTVAGGALGGSLAWRRRRTDGGR